MRKLSHVQYDIEYNIVWTTKYRYHVLKGKTFNADINGALNIMRKSSVVDMNILYGRGEVDTPIRIRIA